MDIQEKGYILSIFSQAFDGVTEDTEIVFTDSDYYKFDIDSDPVALKKYAFPYGKHYMAFVAAKQDNCIAVKTFDVEGLDFGIFTMYERFSDANP